MALCQGKLSAIGMSLSSRCRLISQCWTIGSRPLSCTPTRLCAAASKTKGESTASKEAGGNGQAPTEFKVIGVCTGVDYLKDEGPPPMYEDAYYPDWLFEIPLRRLTLLELDPDGKEFAQRIKLLKMSANNYRHKYKLDMFVKKVTSF